RRQRAHLDTARALQKIVLELRADKRESVERRGLRRLRAPVEARTQRNLRLRRCVQLTTPARRRLEQRAAVIAARDCMRRVQLGADLIVAGQLVRQPRVQLRSLLQRNELLRSGGRASVGEIPDRHVERQPPRRYERESQLPIGKELVVDERQKSVERIEWASRARIHREYAPAVPEAVGSGPLEVGALLPGRGYRAGVARRDARLTGSGEKQARGIVSLHAQRRFLHEDLEPGLDVEGARRVRAQRSWIIGSSM